MWQKLEYPPKYSDEALQEKHQAELFQWHRKQGLRGPFDAHHPRHPAPSPRKPLPHASAECRATWRFGAHRPRASRKPRKRPVSPRLRSARDDPGAASQPCMRVDRPSVSGIWGNAEIEGRGNTPTREDSLRGRRLHQAGRHWGQATGNSGDRPFHVPGKQLMFRGQIKSGLASTLSENGGKAAKGTEFHLYHRHDDGGDRGKKNPFAPGRQAAEGTREEGHGNGYPDINLRNRISASSPHARRRSHGLAPRSISPATRPPGLAEKNLPWQRRGVP